MLHLPQISPLPGPIDDLVARTALRLVDWLHGRLRRREPTLATRPLPTDPWERIRRSGRRMSWKSHAPRS